MENTHTAYRFSFMWILGHHVPVVQGTINLYPRVISYNFHMELIQFRKPYCHTCGLVGKYGSLPVGFPCLAFPSLFSLSLETNPERRRSRFFAENNTHPSSGTAGAVENGNNFPFTSNQLLRPERFWPIPGNSI